MENFEANKTRLSVNEDGSEFVNVEKKIGEKINEFLDLQNELSNSLEEVDMKKYFELADKIQGVNCHKTALYLEDRITEAELYDINNNDIEFAGHNEILETSIILEKDELETLKTKKAPFIISFFKEKEGAMFPYHSILFLGKSNKGKLVAFQKNGPYSDNGFKYIDFEKTLKYHLENGYKIGIEK